MGLCSGFLDRLTRRKHYTDEELVRTNLNRVLSVIDLVALGVGSTLGAGAYVLAGQVAKRDAGPAVIVSFLIAAVASMLAGVCYAEFGARVPKAGSAYVYIYVTVAELAAFVIGWDLILEYVIGAASVARTASGYIDDIVGNKIVPWFEANLSMGDTGVLAPYADLLAMLIVLVLTAILAGGVKESATVNKIFTALNLGILSYVCIIGAFKDDPGNWFISESEAAQHTDCGHTDNTTGCGTGGFMPYGFNGIIKGAASCFFAFVGFDSIATTGEEAKNPQRNIPLATILSLLIVLLFYSGISISITMMAPYYALDMNAPFATVFKNVGWNISRYIVSVGAICALTTSLLGGMFPLPRVMLAMARDGLLFRFFARVEKRVKTPVIATIVAGLFAAVMATIFDVDALVDMLSIGTLMAYTLVATSVLLLRYEEPNMASESTVAHRNPFGRVFRPGPTPSMFSITLVRCLTFFLVVDLVSLALLISFGASYVFISQEWWALLIFVLLIVMALVTVTVIWRQPVSKIKLDFKTPLVPWLPALSIFVNAYLMINLDLFTWIRFFVWMGIGFLVYFGYGVWHSTSDDIIPIENDVIVVEHQRNDGPLDIYSSRTIATKTTETGLAVAVVTTVDVKVREEPQGPSEYKEENGRITMSF